jgi:hypothetical protein
MHVERQICYHIGCEPASPFSHTHNNNLHVKLPFSFLHLSTYFLILFYLWPISLTKREKLYVQKSVDMDAEKHVSSLVASMSLPGHEEGGNVSENKRYKKRVIPYFTVVRRSNL